MNLTVSAKTETKTSDRRLVPIAAVVAVALLVLVGCRRSENAHELVIRLGEEARLALPSGSRVVELYDPDLFIDPVWAAKVAIPRTAYKAFKATLEARPSGKSDISMPLSDTLKWWRPQKQLLAKDFWDPERETSVRIVVSEEHGKIFAYIEYSVF